MIPTPINPSHSFTLQSTNQIPNEQRQQASDILTLDAWKKVFKHVPLEHQSCWAQVCRAFAQIKRTSDFEVAKQVIGLPSVQELCSRNYLNIPSTLTCYTEAPQVFISLRNFVSIRLDFLKDPRDSEYGCRNPYDIVYNPSRLENFLTSASQIQESSIPARPKRNKTYRITQGLSTVRRAINFDNFSNIPW